MGRGIVATISRLVALVLLAIAVTYPARLPAEETQIHSIVKAGFADGRLWLLSDLGDLSSLTETSQSRQIEHLPEKVLDLCVSNGHATVVTKSSDGKKNGLCCAGHPLDGA